MVLAAASGARVQAQALELPPQEWNDFYPFRMTLSFYGASEVGDNYTARYGSTSAYALHGLTYAMFVANATDQFNYTLWIRYPTPVTQQILVTVSSYDKFKNFVIPITNETYIRLTFLFNLEPQPQIPSAAEFADLAAQSFKNLLQQYINLQLQSQDVMNRNQTTIALVVTIQFALIILLVVLFVKSQRGQR